MTGAEAIKKIEKKLDDIDNLILREIMGTYNRDFMRRIFEQGKRANGSKIGSYSTKPLVVSVNAVTPRKQTGDKVWVPKKNNKGYYGYLYEGGYKQFKDEQGRNSAFVDFRLTEKLKIDLSAGFKKKGNRIVLATSAKKFLKSKGKKKTYITNGKKVKYLEDKYGDDIFTFGEKHLKDLRKRIRIGVAKMFNNA